jgi:DNA (cytosine-5)-methyltransferase 1
VTGIGSQAKALKNLGIPFEHYKVVEWDKYAIKSYNAIHNTDFVTQDITKIKGEDLGIVDTDIYDYLLTYSFPCQDLSIAGKQRGMAKGTRSGLLWEVERLLNECDELPQYLLMENVPEVIGQKNIKDFAKWLEFLESLGYKNYYQVLNAKDYGIPQNRERCFMASFIDKRVFQFPKPMPLKLRLKDLLENDVDEKYYLDQEHLQRISKWNSFQNPLENVYGLNSILPTITTRVAESDAGGINASTILISKDIDDKKDLRNDFSNKKIRTLTPLETWGGIGFTKEKYFNAYNELTFLKLTEKQIEGWLYKQAGNSIVVNVLMEIFKKMFIDNSIENYQTNIFEFINKEENENEQIF